ncbi:ribonuclease E/G [Neogemmobacter tilapiae]|uniref:Ribonuclease G n=1 Tax=Neogemmobacter tilapiae TaxID=875041 RepID=A0A918TPH4_9RHOB|nr:ribonuclease E/G [Gemmobacter tilapiae]GHC56760.1 ribonuclease G [Gemmobacter tilapiae]
MKGRVVVLDEFQGRAAAALVVDGVLMDVLIDPEGDDLLPGAICRALADRPMKGMGGMFVKLPAGQSGFLRQTDGVAPGRTLLVQVTGPAEPGKALPVTTRLLFKSRFAIVTPGAPGLNISRKIHDEGLRGELAEMAAAGMEGADETLGLILRSACADAEPEAVAEDIAAMRGLAEQVLADVTGQPELLVEGASAQDVAWRDWLDPVPDEVITEEGGFETRGVLDLLGELLQPRVDLTGGASMFIESTRALVAIDVNTGADTSPATGLKANIACARDLPRQLRLRGLGGQIVIDFAPIPKRDRAVLDQVIKAAFKGEAAETHLVGWTALGLYELVRKRDRLPLMGDA